jgi:hypothetical protein
MQIKKNVTAAIAAAVGLYLEAERRMAASPQVVEKAPAPPVPAFSPWVMAGRQSMMEMRRMWQMRL